MILISAFVLLLQESAAAPAAPPDAAHARYEALAKSWSGAAALETAVVATGEEEREDGSSIAHEFRFELHMAHPWWGTMQGQEFVDGELAGRTDIVGDGTKVYMLNHDEKSYDEIEDYSDGFVEALTPLRTWFSRKVSEPDSVVLLPPDEKRPGQQGIKLSFEDTTETYWLDASDKIVAGELSFPEMAKPVALEFTRWIPHATAKPEEWAGKLPEGYTPSDSGASSASPQDLLPVGSEAPAVTLKDMDGKEFQLAALRGRTVLLNFWFRH